MTSGVPEMGSSKIIQGSPNTVSINVSVTISLGVPVATTCPDFMAIRLSAYRQAWLRSCNTATMVWPCSRFKS